MLIIDPEALVDVARKFGAKVDFEIFDRNFCIFATSFFGEVAKYSGKEKRWGSL